MLAIDFPSLLLRADDFEVQEFSQFFEAFVASSAYCAESGR
jgi:hypothetical protein